MVSSSALTIVGGTYACRWRELRPINFGGGGGGASGTADPSSLENGTAGGSGGDEDDDVGGFSRGRGRGRGRDGAGDYEMVGLKGDRDKRGD